VRPYFRGKLWMNPLFEKPRLGGAEAGSHDRHGLSDDHPLKQVAKGRRPAEGGACPAQGRERTD